jgi:hypothetical protein
MAWRLGVNRLASATIRPFGRQKNARELRSTPLPSNWSLRRACQLTRPQGFSFRTGQMKKVATVQPRRRPGPARRLFSRWQASLRAAAGAQGIGVPAGRSHACLSAFIRGLCGDAHTAILDGEAVVLQGNGKSDSAPCRSSSNDRIGAFVTVTRSRSGGSSGRRASPLPKGR